MQSARMGAKERQETGLTLQLNMIPRKLYWSTRVLHVLNGRNLLMLKDELTKCCLSQEDDADALIVDRE
jgi:hypothetical protein